MKAISFIMVFFLLSSVVIAADAGSLPGSSWYWLDTLSEKVQVFLTFNKENREELKLEHARERLLEATELANQVGDNETASLKTTESINALVAKYEKVLVEIDRESIESLDDDLILLTNLQDHVEEESISSLISTMKEKNTQLLEDQDIDDIFGEPPSEPAEPAADAPASDPLDDLFGEPPQAINDIDGDGEVTQDDFERIQVVGNEVKPSDIENADVNQDGLIDELDKELLEKIIDTQVDIDENGVVDNADVIAIEEIIDSTQLNVNLGDLEDDFVEEDYAPVEDAPAPPVEDDIFGEPPTEPPANTPDEEPIEDAPAPPVEDDIFGEPPTEPPANTPDEEPIEDAPAPPTDMPDDLY